MKGGAEGKASEACREEVDECETGMGTSGMKEESKTETETESERRRTFSVEKSKPMLANTPKLTRIDDNRPSTPLSARKYRDRDEEGAGSGGGELGGGRCAALGGSGILRYFFNNKNCGTDGIIS